MRDLAEIIRRELLPRVRQPGQYVGLETHAAFADVEAAEVTFALAFPDAYTVGISHFGTQVLYRLLNDLPGVACDRTYCPLPDAEAVCRQRRLPWFAWESRRALRDFDVLGFSVGYELCATNVLTILDLAGIPLRAADRTGADPLVIAGDAIADAPEPLADFIDAFLVGEGEATLPALARLVADARRRGAAREQTLLAVAGEVPGAYVPRFYRPVPPGPGAPLGAVEPARDDVPAVIEHVHVPDLGASPPLTRPLVPLVEGVHDRVVVEVMRGCPNACRFCQAGAVRLPVRSRGVEEIVSAAVAGVESTGCREVALLSLSTSDLPGLREVIARLDAELAPRNVSISLPSLRVDSQLEHLPRLTSTVRKGGLTIAAEAGSDRLRRALRKRITEEAMLTGVRAAFEAGFKSVKVYFIAGLPGETDADIEAIVGLCRRLSDTRREVDGHRGAIQASVSWFVPKPHTPMQWAPMRDADYFLGVRRRLLDLSKRTPVSFRFHRVERSVLEGVLARGDRSLGRVIEAAWRRGARLDAWNEHWDWEIWQAAFEDAGIDPRSVAGRELQPGPRLPWSHIACPRRDAFLRKQRDEMLEALREG